MYIVSKKKDYYEVLPNNQDDRPIYVREEEPVEVPLDVFAALLKTFPIATPIGPRRRSYAEGPAPDEFGVIAFCGTAHPYYAVRDGEVLRYLYSVEAYLEARRILPEAILYINDWTATSKNWKRYLDEVSRFDFEPLHRAFDAPVLLFGSGPDLARHALRNPYLKDRDFASQVDPWSAWQTIDTYLGSVLAKQEDPESARTDDLARDMHGFDDRSFRGPEKGSKARRRRQNKAGKQKRSEPE